jgi:hypothetical protein
VPDLLKRLVEDRDKKQSDLKQSRSSAGLVRDTVEASVSAVKRDSLLTQLARGNEGVSSWSLWQKDPVDGCSMAHF